jgi:TatA/E family protein of Tat protein translocase
VSLGPAEILVIFVIALLVFGPQRLPEIGRQVGRGVRELRKLQHTLRSDLDEVLADDMSGHVEPAPTLPPLSEDAPAAQTGDLASAPEVGAPAPDTSIPQPPPDPT